MFEHFKRYSRIIVSGPQRSGTRIATKMIAEDCNYTYIDEREFKVNNLDLLDSIMQRENLVIQGPGICHLLHTFPYHSLLICMMVRSVDDIELSEQRIGWNDKGRKLELKYYSQSEGSPAKAKYEFWEKVQKPLLAPHYEEINYNELSNHPLFVKKEDRKNFKWDQLQK